MKQLIVALLFAVAIPSSAVEVTAQGSGATMKAAIQDAKNNALEQVTGAFVVNQSTTDGRSVSSKSAQYSGGVVKKYQMTSSSYDGHVHDVTIVADVDPAKSNGMIVPTEIDLTEKSMQIQEHADRYSNVERIAKALDSRQAAFTTVPPKIEYVPRGEMVEVRVTTGVVLQKKWVDDVKIMSQQAGSPIDVKTSTSDVLWGIGVATAPFSLVGSSMIRTAAQFTANKPTSYIASNCFSRTNAVDVDECYAVGYMFGNVVRNDRFLVVVTLWSGDKLVQELPVAVVNDNQLFALHDDGTRLYFRTSAKERRFHSRGVVWFTDGMAIGRNAFMINAQQLAQVDRMEYALR